MKIRNGFVSNSSSSSFVISLDEITPKQVEKIHNHTYHAQRILETYDGEDRPDFGYPDEPWSITQTAETIEGFTIIDNFNMYNYLEHIGVGMSKVKWRE